jgi:Domain of unknown function (DUF4936)
MEHWYVYYECPAAAASQIIERARFMQDALRATHGVTGRLVQSIASGTRTTLMEIYEHIEQPERFAAALSDALAHSGLTDEMRDARHIERFTDI